MSQESSQALRDQPKDSGKVEEPNLNRRSCDWVPLSGSTIALYASSCRSIGQPDLIEEPRFRANQDCCNHSAELKTLFRDWFAQNDLAAILERFEAYGGTIAPIYSGQQIAEDPHVQARGFLQEVQDKDFGKIRILGVVPRFGNHTCAITRKAGEIGADNEVVYRDKLGLSNDEIVRLRQQNVI